jgi:hypothetical protein
VELVARNLNVELGGLIWIHTFINIHSIDQNGVKNNYTIGGQLNPITKKLNAEFNNKYDTITQNWLIWKLSYKWSVFFDAPEWFTDSGFVRNIYDEYVNYNVSQQHYNAASVWSKLFDSWNCNNFTTSLLYNASNYDRGVVSKIEWFNPIWANPWLWESIYTSTYKISRPSNSCS